MRLYLACLISIMALTSAPSGAAQTPVEIVGAEFDFGMVPQNATLTHRIWIRSISEDTITLSNIKTGCGCLTAPLPQHRLGPGDSLLVTFYWQTRGSEGPQGSSAYLYTEPAERPLELTLSGNVVTQLDTAASIAWAPVRFAVAGNTRSSGSGKVFVLDLTNKSSIDLAVTIVECGPELEPEMPDSIGAGEILTGRVTVAEAYLNEEFESSFTLELSGNQETRYRVSIPVVCGDFSFRPMFTTTRE